MDLSNISKAIAGGISGVVATVGTTGVVYVAVPATSGLPAWVYAGLPILNALIGFAIGFYGVYRAPANVPASPTPK